MNLKVNEWRLCGMFTKEELLVLEEAVKIADAEYIKIMDESKSNKNRLVAYNRKQKKLWLVQNKLKKLIEENKYINKHLDINFRCFYL